MVNRYPNPLLEEIEKLQAENKKLKEMLNKIYYDGSEISDKNWDELEKIINDNQNNNE